MKTKVLVVLICITILTTVFNHFPALATATYTESITVANNMHLSLPPLVNGFKANHYNVGDTVDLVITNDYTYNESSELNIDNSFITGVITAERIDGKTIRVTCVGEGLVRLTTGALTSSGTSATMNFYFLVGYDYPKTIGNPVTAESSGYLYEIPSSAKQNYNFGDISDGIYRTGANLALQTVTAFGEEFVIQRFDEMYQIEKLMLYFRNGSTLPTPIFTPTKYDIYLCEDPFPLGYEQNTKINASAGEAFPHSTKGNFTDFYTFQNGSPNFGQAYSGGNGTIRDDFMAKINQWPWKKIYGGTSAENVTTVNIGRSDLLRYMDENNPSGNLSGYFIKVVFSRPGTTVESSFELLQLMLDTTPTRIANVPGFTPTHSGDAIAGIDKDISYNVRSNEKNPVAQIEYKVFNDEKGQYNEEKTINATVTNLGNSTSVPKPHSNEHSVVATIPGEEITGSRLWYKIKFGAYESTPLEYTGLKTVNSVSIEQNRFSIYRNKSVATSFSVSINKGSYTHVPMIKWKEVDASGDAITEGNKLNISDSGDSPAISVKSDITLDLSTYKTAGYGAITYVSAFAGGKQSKPSPVWILPDVFDSDTTAVASPAEINLINTDGATEIKTMDLQLILLSGQNQLSGIYKGEITNQSDNQSFVVDTVDYQISNDNNMLEVVKDESNPHSALLKIKEGVSSTATLAGATVTATIKDISGAQINAIYTVNVINQLSPGDLSDIEITKLNEDPIPMLYNGDGSYELLSVNVTGKVKNVSFNLSEADKEQFEIYDIFGPDTGGTVTAKVKAIGEKPKATANVVVKSVLSGVTSSVEFQVSYRTEPLVTLYEYHEESPALHTLLSVGTKKVILAEIYPSYATDSKASYDVNKFRSELGADWFKITVSSGDNFDAHLINSEEINRPHISITGTEQGEGVLSVNSTGSKNSSAKIGVTTINPPPILTDIKFKNNKILLKKGDIKDLSQELILNPSNISVDDILFTSSDTKVAVVVGGNSISAVNSGKAIITAMLANGGIKADLEVYAPSVGENVALRASITDTHPIKLNNINSTTISELTNGNPADTNDAYKYLTGLGEITMYFGDIQFEPSEIRMVWYTRGQMVMPKAYTIQSSVDGITWNKFYETQDATEGIPTFVDLTSQRTTTQTLTEFEDVEPCKYLKFCFTEFSEQSLVPLAIGIREIEIVSGQFSKDLTLAFAGSNGQLKAGDTASVTSRYNDQAFPLIFFTSSDPSVATVNSSGTITGVRSGTASISASTPCGITTASLDVQVENNIKEVKIYQENKLISSGIRMAVGDARNLTAKTFPETAEVGNVVWEVESGSNVTVDQNGHITANSAGTAQIRVTASFSVDGESYHTTKSCQVQVIAQKVAVQSIDISPKTLSQRLGESSQLVATPSGAGGAEPTNDNVIWYSTNDNVAIVDQTGLVHSVGSGTAKIFAVSEDGAKGVFADVTVLGVALNAVLIEGFEWAGFDSTNKKLNPLRNKVVAKITAVDQDGQPVAGMFLKDTLVNGTDYVCNLPIGLTVATTVNSTDGTITFTFGGELAEAMSDDISLAITIKKSAMPGAESDAMLACGIKSVKAYVFTYEATEDNSIRMETASSVSTADNSFKIKVIAHAKDGEPMTEFKIKHGTYSTVDFKTDAALIGLAPVTLVGNAQDNTIRVTLRGTASANITEDQSIGLEFNPTIIAESPSEAVFEFEESPSRASIIAPVKAGTGGIISGTGTGTSTSTGSSSSGVGVNSVAQRTFETGTLNYKNIGTNEIAVTPKKDVLENNIEAKQGGTVTININLLQNASIFGIDIERDTYQKAAALGTKLEIVARGIAVTINPEMVKLSEGRDFSMKLSRIDGDLYEIAIPNMLPNSPFDVKIDYNSAQVVTYTKLYTEILDGGQWLVIPSKSSTSGFVTCTMENPGQVRLLEGNVEFSDVHNHWAQRETEILGARKIINGINDQEFSPDSDITRAELAALLVRAILGNSRINTEGKFDDVREDAWYYNSVNKLAQMGIVEGTGEKFEPLRNVTREEMTVMIMRAFCYLSPDQELEEASIDFLDKDDISGWAEQAVAQALKLGFVRGVDTTTFEPKGLTSRAQAAVVIYRLLVAFRYF